MDEQEIKVHVEMEIVLKVADEALRDFFHRNNVNYDDFYFSRRIEWITQLAAGYLAGRNGQSVSLVLRSEEQMR